MDKILIDVQYVGKRIDKFLSDKFSDYSRNFFQHIFERKGVLVNGKPVKKSYKLKENDIVEIDDLQRYLQPAILEESPNIDLEVVLDKDDYLVIWKPKGVLSHPNSIWDVKAPSVVGFLYHKYKTLPSIGNFIRAGLIHRLDKDTDGFMIIVKTEKGLKYFKNLFQEKSKLVEKVINEGIDISNLKKLEQKIKLRKFYRAIVYFENKGKRFLDSIKSYPFYIIEEVIPKVPYYIPKIGITKILQVQFLTQNIAKLDIEILTGRTHQIRYHLFSKGLYIIGDKLYGIYIYRQVLDKIDKHENKDLSKFLLDFSQENRQDIDMMLTAYRLKFKDVEGEIIDLKR